MYWYEHRNLSKQRNIKLVTAEKRWNYLVSDYDTKNIFISENLLAMNKQV